LWRKFGSKARIKIFARWLSKIIDISLLHSIVYRNLFWFKPDHRNLKIGLRVALAVLDAVGLK
jgi:hypothetical protein